MPASPPPIDTIALVLGDQLTLANPVLLDLDPASSSVLMIENAGEATHVWSHKARIAVFLAAMRHFRDELRAAGFRVLYQSLDDAAGDESVAAQTGAGGGAGGDDLVGTVFATMRRAGARQLRVCEPGEWRLEQGLRAGAATGGHVLEVLPDPGFLCSREQFARWAGDSASLRMEFFYRRMRQQHGVLLDDAGKPEGNRWNFDADNRKAYPKSGPSHPPARRFPPDALTRGALATTERLFGGHPGSLGSFDWPVSRAEALLALEHFVEHRLAGFGEHQDAMWTDTPYGSHALLSSALNLRLLLPGEVIRAAETAWREGRAPLAAVEGFIRQILGWREFIRGVYWLDMPGMAQANHYGHQRNLPAWFWTGDTGMACQRAVIGQTLEHGYAHHIQRLMVLGNFALLAQIAPQQVANWFLAIYVDAVEWAELPNVAGMALHANGGRFTSKPYIASGAYIKRQSNYCKGCRYQPQQRTGDKACPFTTLYWHFMAEKRASLAANPRASLMVKNLDRIAADDLRDIARTARRMLDDLDAL